MRIFLYLFALLAGLSPAEASRAALSSPVSIGAAAAFSTSESSQKDCAHQAVLVRQAATISSRISERLAFHVTPVPQRAGLAYPITDRLRE